jgi:hypothetical protein
MVPRAEYQIYRKQVEVLNRTSKRISALTQQLKVAGIYNAVTKASELLRAQDGEFIPITTGDINASVKDMIEFWPFERIAAVLANLYKVREDQLNIIYQITGLSDIVRGASNASETATAQQLKGNFANMRMEPRQRPLQEMIRDLYRIKAEIIAEHFDPSVLEQMTQLPVLPEMIDLMRRDKIRCYNIDIETDSTVQPDADSEKSRRVEFLAAFSDSMQKIAPLIQGGLMDMETAKQVLLFTMRGFKVSRELEDAFENLGAQQQQQQKPDPAMEQLKAEMQFQMQKMQQEFQLEMQKMAMEMQMGREELQQEAQLAREKMALDASIKRDQVEANAAIKAHSSKYQSDTRAGMN